MLDSCPDELAKYSPTQCGLPMNRYRDCWRQAELLHIDATAACYNDYYAAGLVLPRQVQAALAQLLKAC